MPSNGDLLENGPDKNGVEKLFSAYVDRLNAGDVLDHEEIRSRHPEDADELFEQLEAFEGLFGDARPRPPLGALGDYTLRRQLGRGGMGVVYEAWQGSMDRVVALKVLPPGVAADDRAFQRFLQEAKTAGKLNHQNIVGVHSTGVEEGTPWYSMELVEGETLAQVLAKLKEAEPDTETPFGRKDSLAYYSNLADAFADVAEGLQHAHSKRVVHRDIKPSNLILDDDGRLRILDFGLAHLEGQESLTLLGDVVGTPAYMSPEQAARRKIPVDHRTDIYSLGATLYELLTHQQPFRGKDHADTLSQIIDRDPRPPRQWNPRVPADLETITLKCLRKASENRYGTAEALAQDLRRFVRAYPIEARPQSGWERLAAWVKRQRRRLLVAAALLASLLAVFWYGYRAEQAEYVAQKALFRPALLKVLSKIREGEFSLRISSGQTDALFASAESKNRFTLVAPENVKELVSARGDDPHQDAVKELEDIARHLPAQRDAHYHLAKAYRALGLLERATESLARALALDAEFVPARVLALELAGKSRKETSAELKRLLTQYEGGTGWERWWLLAYQSLAKKKWSKAARAYDELIAAGKALEEPLYIAWLDDAYLERGVARMESGDSSQAQEDFVLAADRAPGLEPALLLAKAYHLSGAEKDAERTFRRLYDTTDPAERTETALWIVAVYDALGDYQKALEWTNAELGEASIRTRVAAFLHYRLGHIQDAVREGAKAIQRDREDLMAHLVLAAALLKDLWSGNSGADRGERLALLLNVSRRAVELDPDHPSAQALLATAEGEQKQEAVRLRRRTVMRTKVGMSTRVGTTRALSSALALSLGLVAGGQAQEGGFWDDVRLVEGPNSTAIEWRPVISHDGLTLIFSSTRPGGAGGTDLYMAIRSAPDQPFESLRNLAEVNTARDEWGGCLSADGLELFFDRETSETTEAEDLFVATRDDPEGTFGPPVPLVELNTVTGNESMPWIAADHQRLYFNRGGVSGGVLVATRPGRGEPFGNVSRVFGSEFADAYPSVSADGSTLFLSDVPPPGIPFRPGGLGGMDLWSVPLSAPDQAIPPPVNLGAPLNTAVCDGVPSISSDWPASGSKIYFVRSASCEAPDVDIYEATWHADAFHWLDDFEDGELLDGAPSCDEEVCWGPEVCTGVGAHEIVDGDLFLRNDDRPGTSVVEAFAATMAGDVSVRSQVTFIGGGGTTEVNLFIGGGSGLRPLLHRLPQPYRLAPHLPLGRAGVAGLAAPR